MREVEYQADPAGIRSGAREVERLASDTARLIDRFVADYEKTAGWQGSGDALADQLTVALAAERADILDSCLGFQNVLRNLADASGRQVSDVTQPVHDASQMIHEAHGRH
ncbi:hypothetical protein [Streptomyces hirsutus]|uniref:hypothetical protein n=1 Tax=Streptomyces hirsutus TaxID=35620 RepID=UPI0033C8C7AF